MGANLITNAIAQIDGDEIHRDNYLKKKYGLVELPKFDGACII